MTSKFLSLFLLIPVLAAPARAAYSASEFLDFSLTPAQIKAKCDAGHDGAQAAFAAVAAVPAAERTFENTALALDRAVAALDEGVTGPTFLKYVSTDKAVRDAGHECETLIEKYYIEIETREDLYKALKELKDRGLALKPEQARLLDKQLLGFEQNGLGLPADEREQVKKLKTELVELEATFGKNVNEVTDFLTVSEAELDGLPKDFIEKLEKTADGRYKLTMNYPDVFPFLRNAKNAEARRKMETMFSNRAADKNIEPLEQAIALRYRIANLLGYPNHAEYKLADRMAEKPGRVDAFLKDLIAKLKEKAGPELERMRKLKKKQEGSDVFESWDWAYYNNWLKKNEYDVDDEAIKEYFPFEHVTRGMFDVYQTLLGVTFEQVADAATWHPDVKLFKVTDTQSGELVAHFFMDLYPREGKYKHAAAFTLVKGRLLPDGTYRKPVSSIVANFDKPAPGKASLMKHGEVETYFHEFGHIMHQTLTRAPYARFSGTSVSRDFVEAPSQIFENWVWEKDILKKISKHYKTGKPLPNKLIKKMRTAKLLNAGLTYLRQAFYASVDMNFHTHEKVDTTKVYGDLKRSIAMIPMTPGTHPQASFGHLMGGYDAGYYGYLWSEVYALDMYSVFKEKGILDPEVGMNYRRLILEPGRMNDEMVQLKKFLGREPSPDAFVESLGL